MDLPILAGIAVVVVGLLVTVAILVVNRGRPTPDQPLGHEAEHQPNSYEPDRHDRPAGADAEQMSPRPGTFEPGDAGRAAARDAAPDSADRPPR